MPNIIDNEDLYGSILLDGKKSPGKVTLSGHDRKINFNIKYGYALEGASTTYKNTPPIEFTASFYLVKDPGAGIDDFADWDKFRPIIDATVSGRQLKAVAIYHPDLIENDIKAVCKAQVGGRVYDGRGGCTIVVKFQEYRAVKIKSGSLAPAPGKDPNADLKAQIAELTARYQKTPWQ